jgi:tetratricopeptide (TPR) repeat protein
MLRPYRTLVLCALLFCATAAALSLVDVNVNKKDPINGDTVECRQMASFSYLHAPWGEAAELGVPPTLLHLETVCENPRSGYIAFTHDFEQLSAAERERIERWLRQNPRRPTQQQPHRSRTVSAQELDPDFVRQMQRLEALYDLRDLDPQYRANIKRIMAIVYKFGGQDHLYRARLRESILSLRRELAAAKTAEDANELRSLLVEHHLRLGETKAAQSYLLEVAATKDTRSVVALWHRFGKHYFARGDFAEACRYLRRAWNAPFLDAEGNVDSFVDFVRSGIVELERNLPKDYRFIDADWEGRPNKNCM